MEVVEHSQVLLLVTHHPLPIPLPLFLTLLYTPPHTHTHKNAHICARLQ